MTIARYKSSRTLQEVTLAPGEKKRMVVEAVPRYGIVMLRVTPLRAELLVRGLQLLDQTVGNPFGLGGLPTDPYGLSAATSSGGGLP